MTVLKHQWVQSEVMIQTIIHISASNKMIIICPDFAG